jgi:hypothetical protein
MAILQDMSEYTWPLLAGIGVLWLVGKVMAHYKLSQFHGPWMTAFSDLPHSVQTYTGEAHSWYCDINEKYGRYFVLSCIGFMLIVCLLAT